MNSYKLFKAGIHAADGIKRFNGNAATYEKYLREFPNNTCFAELRDAVEAGDVKAAFAAGHALKGVAGNLSMEDLYQALLPLVEELRADSLEQAPALLEAAAREYERVITALQENV